MSPPMKLVIDVEECRTVVTLRGECDMASSPVLMHLAGKLEDHTNWVAFDLRDLTFLDSSGLRGLVEARRSLMHRGCRVTFEIPDTGSARKVLEITGILGLFAGETVSEGSNSQRGVATSHGGLPSS